MMKEMERFPIGFWNYAPISIQSPKDVKDWADLGMTMANSPEFKQGDDKQAMLDILDACEENGIRVILCDHRARWYGLLKDPEGFDRRFGEALADFGQHPAVIGFHVGDEPNTEETFAESAAAHRRELEMAPHLLPHLNFLPYWEGIEGLLGAPTFLDWAKDFAAKSDLKILCYDCYAQMNPDEDGIDFYYTNLRKFSEAADALGITPWTTLLSVGHYLYRCPNEDEFRWQLNTAVASGMKGIMWFFIRVLTPFSNYRLAPIDEFGERTETFQWLSRVNRHFLHRFGDFFLHANHIATYHTVKAYGGYELFEPGKTDADLLDVTCDHELPAVVGIFERDGQRYFAIVNNSMKESGRFKLHTPKEGGKLQRLSWSGDWTDMKVDNWDAYYDETDTEQIGGDWLAPGQMNLYRYER